MDLAMILEIVGVVLFFNYYCTHTTTAHIPYYYLRACCWRQNKERCQDELHGLVLHVMFKMNWKVTDEVHNGDLNSISRTCTIGLVLIVLPVHVRVVYTYWILKNWNCRTLNVHVHVHVQCTRRTMVIAISDRIFVTYSYISLISAVIMNEIDC